MFVILHFRSLRHGKTDAGEDIDNLFAHQRKRVARTQLDRIRRTGQIRFVACRLTFVRDLLTHGVDAGLRLLTKLVEHLTNLAFLVGRHIAELVE